MYPNCPTLICKNMRCVLTSTLSLSIKSKAAYTSRSMAGGELVTCAALVAEGERSVTLQQPNHSRCLDSQTNCETNC